MDITKGEHVNKDDFDKIEPGKPGESPENPCLVAPEDWHDNGLPYGAWCKCSACGMIGRSTFGFDFCAKEPGDKLECEPCSWRRQGVFI